MAIPIEFVLFSVTLVGVALFHRYTLQVALAGLGVITSYRLAFTEFDLVQHLGHEWVLLANLAGLLVGFALLADHFERSQFTEVLPRFLPDDWKGGFALLVIVFVLSSFLDNIAGAILGGTMAARLFRGRVHLGFVAAIVAASNAGGAGSVVGDTTTTMMWLDGVSALTVLKAYAAAVPVLVVSGLVAARQQDRHQRIVKDAPEGVRIDWGRVGVVAAILVAAIAANVAMNTRYPAAGELVPGIAIAIWSVLLFCAPFRKPDWGLVPGAARGAVFLLALVLCASMMPVEKLPQPSAINTFGLGFLSAVFDNIPLTALALHQGGYDWGALAFAVGYGGSMVWFGSSAGVAISGRFPEARNALAWLRDGWHVAAAYVVGYAVMIALLGWQPGAAAP